MSAPEFSVIIPHRNDFDGLERTLVALDTLFATPSFEVIIADNGSMGGVAAVSMLAARHPSLDLRVIDAPEPGAGPARNAGAALARAPMLAFLDCDCLPDADWLQNAQQPLKQANAVLGGPVIASICNRPMRGINPAELFDVLYGFNVARSFHLDGLLLTANLLMPRATFQRVGPYLTGLSEDRDWCQRARDLGFTLTLAPDLAVHHLALDDADRLRARWARIARETHAYHHAHGSGRSSGLRYALVVALSPLVHGWRLLGPKAAGAPMAVRLRCLLLLLSVRAQRAWIGARLALCDKATAFKDALWGWLTAKPSNR